MVEQCLPRPQRKAGLTNPCSQRRLGVSVPHSRIASPAAWLSSVVRHNSAMRLPRILKNPVVALHAIAWAAIAVYYGLEPFSRIFGMEQVYESLMLGLALYLFWGVTAVACLPACWLSFRGALRTHDRALVAQSGIGALLALSVLGYAAFLLALIWSSPG